jgi:hypothetical protein
MARLRDRPKPGTAISLWAAWEVERPICHWKSRRELIEGWRSLADRTVRQGQPALVG